MGEKQNVICETLHKLKWRHWITSIQTKATPYKIYLRKKLAQ